ncbi:MAG TPA: arginase family protein [Jatrophihabitantaceae bacterium]|jgi:arginase
MTVVTLLSAPTNLGLRPPVPTATPGCAKAPEVLRAAGLYQRLGAEDSGLVPCPRYVDDVRPGRIRNQDAILDYSTRLADRLGALLDDGRHPLVLGGDCSLLLGVGLALRRRGRYGLVHIDGHTDFRHPGNSDVVASLAGEDLAAAVGLHYPAVSLLGGEQHFQSDDVAQVGCRDDDEAMDEAGALLAVVVPASHVVNNGVPAVIDPIVTTVVRPELDGYWIHVDLDVLDDSVMRAVDSPSPGGLSPDQLIELLQVLAPKATGAHVGIYDPDLDPDGSAARVVVDCVVEGLARIGSTALAK